MKDLTGTQIGSLTVLRYEPHFEKVTKKSQQKVTEVWQGRWICLCDCGKEIPVLANRLLHKKTLSCGCQSKNKPKELTGQRFGKLLVLSRAENDSRGKTRWVCRCDCGKETIVVGDKLIARLTSSCGCIKAETPSPEILERRNQAKRKVAEKNREDLFLKIKEECLKKDITLETSLEEFVSTKMHPHRLQLNLSCEKGHSFQLAWFNLNQSDIYCRKCFQFKSKGEEEIRHFVMEFFPEKRVDSNIKYLVEGVNEVDIYIRPLYLAIEYNGLYWHHYKPGDDKERHLKKRELLNKHGIECIQINEDEWLHKKEIIKSILLSKFKKTPRKVYGRHCKIKSLTGQEAANFLQANHLMGPHKASKALALYLSSGEIVAALTYRIQGDELEISRFCSVLNTQVLGGLTKLLAAVLKDSPNINRVISWVDLRYGNGKSLERNGFHREKVTLGWKWTDFEQTYNRLRCQANMDERCLSEAEHAKELGWARIYDAGQALYAKNLKTN